MPILALVLLALGLTILAGAADPFARGGQRVLCRTEDGLFVTAEVFAPFADKATPLIVLFHQARWSRGEYLEIVPRLNALGFNCMTVDQRSGQAIHGVFNETYRRAQAAGKSTRYADALPDLPAALNRAHKDFAEGPVIAWGSSYSAALALKVAGDRPELVDGVVAFSPGEYFVNQDKPETWIQDSARKIAVPAFVTSARDEQEQWADIFAAIPGEQKVSYVPETEGTHGSRALYAKFPDSEGYWQAVEAFLARFLVEDSQDPGDG